MQLLTQELICARNHYQLKKSLLSWRWEHLLHSALFFLDQGTSGQAQHQTSPVLHDAWLACAGSWFPQQTTFASLLLLEHWHKLIATHPDRATLNDKLGMFLKHFSKQWIKCRVSSEVNRTDYFSTRSYSTDCPCVNCPNHPGSEHGGTSRQWNTGLYLLLSIRKGTSFTHRIIWFLQWFLSVNRRALCKNRTSIIMLILLTGTQRQGGKKERRKRVACTGSWHRTKKTERQQSSGKEKDWLNTLWM